MECIHTVHIEAKAVPLHMELHGLKRHHTKNEVPAVQQLGTHSSTDYSTDSGVPTIPWQLAGKQMIKYLQHPDPNDCNKAEIILTDSFPSYCPFS